MKKTKTLKELIKQDPKVLAKKCKKHFKVIPETLEKELVEIFSNAKVRKELKNKGVAEVDVSKDQFGQVKISILLTNDSAVEKEIESKKGVLAALFDSWKKQIRQIKKEHK